MSKINQALISIFMISLLFQYMEPQIARASKPTYKYTPNNYINISLREPGFENLVAFGRLLGYIQYFHPSDEASKVNWEQFAIMGVSSVEGAQTPEELANILGKLFRPYAPTVRVFPTGDQCHPLQISQYKPEVQILYTVRWEHHGYGFLDNEEDWLRDYFYSKRVYKPIPLSEIETGDFSIEMPLLKDLGGGVSVCVPIVLYATKNGTLPKSTSLKPSSTLFDGQPINPTGNDRTTRLADVILAWNIYQHFYQYYEVVHVDWDNALETALNEAATDINACGFKGTLQKMIAQLEDGHGYVDMKNDPCPYTGLFPMISWDWVENHLVITNAPPLMGRKEGIEPGDVVLAIDGVPAEEAISAKEKYVSGATEERRRYLALKEILRGKVESIILLKLLKPNGKIIYAREMRVYTEVEEFNYPAVKELESGIFYLNLSKITQQEFVDLIPQLSQARGIIFDLRGYPGNILITDLGYLTKIPLTSPKWGFPIIHYPDHVGMTFDFQTWTIEPNTPYLPAKKVFLTDESAISLAETWLSIVSTYHIAEIVGEPSAGENCNAIYEWLPGYYRITWSGCQVINQDGSQFHGIGIQPTIPLQRTINGVIERRDEFLEKAIDIIK